MGRAAVYAAAASVVLFGLKAVGVSEKLAVAVIFAIVGILAVCLLFHIENALPWRPGTPAEGLAYFGMAMFAFLAFFPGAAGGAGLGGDAKKVRKAIFWACSITLC